VAFLLLDGIMAKWADGGGRVTPWRFFGSQSPAGAALWWIETSDVDAVRATRWRQAVADANPEFNFLSGLAAAWKITGDQR
jgi:hypothetical protein